MTEADEELLEILQNPAVKVDIRLIAWNYLLSLTGCERGVKRLVSYKNYGSFLLTHLKESNAEREVLKNAHKCLINLSSFQEGSNFLLRIDKDLVVTLLRGICDPSSNFVEDGCSLLSNLSQHCDILAQEGVESQLPELWEKSLRHNFSSLDKDVREKYTFLALVFANISKTSKGRRLMIDDWSFLSAVLQGFNPTEPDTRRLGTALTIRNCCSETGYHTKLLIDFDILPVLLLPLMGPGNWDNKTLGKLPVECQNLEDTKEREKHPQIRKALVQALSLLCYTEESWNKLKNKGVYYVAREMHKLESDPGVNEALETLVGFLLVENYTNPDSGAPLHSTVVLPEETDELHDIPDVVL